MFIDKNNVLKSFIVLLVASISFTPIYSYMGQNWPSSCLYIPSLGITPFNRFFNFKKPVEVHPDLTWQQLQERAQKEKMYAQWLLAKYFSEYQLSNSLFYIDDKAFDWLCDTLKTKDFKIICTTATAQVKKEDRSQLGNFEIIISDAEDNLDQCLDTLEEEKNLFKKNRQLPYVCYENFDVVRYTFKNKLRSMLWHAVVEKAQEKLNVLAVRKARLKKENDAREVREIKLEEANRLRLEAENRLRLEKERVAKEKVKEQEARLEERKKRLEKENATREAHCLRLENERKQKEEETRLAKEKKRFDMLRKARSGIVAYTQEDQKLFKESLTKEEVQNKCVQLITFFEQDVNDFVRNLSALLLERKNDKLANEVSKDSGLMKSAKDCEEEFDRIAKANSINKNFVSCLRKAYEDVLDEYTGIRRITMLRGIFGGDNFSNAQSVKNNIHQRLAYIRLAFLKAGKDNKDQRKLLVASYQKLCNKVLSQYVAYEKNIRFTAHVQGSLRVSSCNKQLQEKKMNLMKDWHANFKSAYDEHLIQVDKIKAEIDSFIKQLLNLSIKTRTLRIFRDKVKKDTIFDSCSHLLDKPLSEFFEILVKRDKQEREEAINTTLETFQATPFIGDADDMVRKQMLANIDGQYKFYLKQCDLSEYSTRPLSLAFTFLKEARTQAFKEAKKKRENAQKEALFNKELDEWEVLELL